MISAGSGNYFLDETDKQILFQLLENSRRTNTEIAKDIGLSRVSVRNRIWMMEEVGLIQKYTVLIDETMIAGTIPDRRKR